MLNPARYDQVAREVKQRDLDEESIIRELGFRINYARYHAMYPQLPDLPMAMCILGKFGAGKSSTIITLVSILRKFNLFNEFYYFSDSGLLDDKMSVFLRFNNDNFTYSTNNLAQVLGKAYKDRGETPPWEKPKDKIAKPGTTNPANGRRVGLANPKHDQGKLTREQILSMSAYFKPRVPKDRVGPVVFDRADTPETRLDKMRSEITPWKLYIFDDATEMPFLKMHSPFLPFWTSTRHLRVASIMAYHQWKTPAPLLRNILTASVLFSAGNPGELDKMSEETSVPPDVFEPLMEAVGDVGFGSLLLNRNRPIRDRFTYNLVEILPYKEVKAIAKGEQRLPDVTVVDIIPLADPLEDPSWRLKDITRRELELWNTTVEKIRVCELTQRNVEKTPAELAATTRAPKRKRVAEPPESRQAPHNSIQSAADSIVLQPTEMPLKHSRRTHPVTSNPALRSVAVFNAAQQNLRRADAAAVGGALSTAIVSAQVGGNNLAAARLIQKFRLVRSRKATRANIARVGNSIGIGSTLERIDSAPGRVLTGPRRRFLRQSSISRATPNVAPDLRSLVAQLQGRVNVPPQVPPANINASAQLELTKLKLENDLASKKIHAQLQLDLLDKKLDIDRAKFGFKVDEKKRQEERQDRKELLARTQTQQPEEFNERNLDPTFDERGDGLQQSVRDPEDLSDATGAQPLDLVSTTTRQDSELATERSSIHSIEPQSINRLQLATDLYHQGDFGGYSDANILRQMAYENARAEVEFRRPGIKRTEEQREALDQQLLGGPVAPSSQDTSGFAPPTKRQRLVEQAAAPQEQPRIQEITDAEADMITNGVGSAEVAGAYEGNDGLQSDSGQPL